MPSRACLAEAVRGLDQIARHAAHAGLERGEHKGQAGDAAADHDAREGEGEPDMESRFEKRPMGALGESASSR